MLVTLIVVGVLIALVFVLPYVAQGMHSGESRSSGGSGPFGALDELFNPGAHRAQTVQMEQKERRTPTPAPDDPNKG